MNELQKYLDQQHITKYAVSKLSGISRSTLRDATKDTRKLESQTVKTIEAVAKAVNLSAGDVLNSLIELREKEKENDEVRR